MLRLGFPSFVGVIGFCESAVVGPFIHLTGSFSNRRRLAWGVSGEDFPAVTRSMNRELPSLEGTPISIENDDVGNGDGGSGVGETWPTMIGLRLRTFVGVEGSIGGL